MDMEQQQIDPKLLNKTLWLDQEREEEEEAGVDLLARRSSSKHPPNGVGATAKSAEGELESPPSNGTTLEIPDQEVEEREDAPVTACGGENGEGGGNSVYFDKLQGIWICRHCNWSHQIGDPCIHNVQDPEGYLHLPMSTKTLNQWGLETKGTESINEQQSEITEFPSMEINHQMVKNSEDKKDFGLRAAPVEHLHEAANGSFINEKQSEITKSTSMEINHQMVKNSEDKKDFGLRPAPVEHLHEANGSFKHFENGTKEGADVDVFEDIEEDLVDLDVERVLDKQNTHHLYCPNCHSCITKKVILVRRRPKVSIRHRPKRGSKLDLIPNSAGLGGSDDAPEIHPNVSPVAAPDEQNDGREQEQKQEAFSCLSCFSLFIPIGNGCFKILEFFRWGRQTERAQHTQEIRQTENIQTTPEIRQMEHTGSSQRTNLNENTRTPQGVSPSENTQSPQVTSLQEKIEISQFVNQNGNAETPQQVSHDAKKPQDINWNEDTQSPQKISHDANMNNPQHIKHDEDAQKAQPISWNEDKPSHQKISRDENARSLQDINQNNGKQTLQKITTDGTNWKESSPVQAGLAVSLVSAAVLTPSITDKGYIDGVAMKTEPGISGIFSPTKSTLLDKIIADSTEQKPDVDVLQRIVGNEIKDLETGLLEPTFHPGTDVAPLSQRTTETERRGSIAGEVHEWEILKSVVYGGLVESITSLGVVSSAAGAGAATLNVLALGVANLIGGLIIIFHNLRELKNDRPRVGGASDVEEDRYQVLLGRRQNFIKHAVVAILSFLVFGLVPPVVYGFSFRKSDDKDLKLAAVAGASLICIFLLALGKGHVRRPHRTYFRSVSYYIGLGITASGISYVVGQLLKKLLQQLGLFESSSTVGLPLLETVSMEVGRASY
ncbi:Membrane protein of ER body 1 [Hibiscus syriacus]|uniref:Membrane protein of ER body 1 n=1 Tax=Hibiscus syriacus TaxID=106335 RepID=A0A6A2X130_HIBSY|nr:Membrane protein of ER body 1 [Hibiscus syriacus]